MRRLTLLTLGLSLASVACSDYNALERADGAADDWDTGSWDDTGAAGESPDDDDDGASEREDDFIKLLPATTNQYIFVVNSARDTVSRVSVPSLQVLTVEVGSRPKVVRTTADNQRAIVFNEGSDDLTVLDAETLDATSIDVLPYLNAMVLSDDGVWAVVYRDADEEGDGSSGGAQSFNELSIVNTVTGEHFSEVVGFKPRQVKFTGDSSRALVVSDEYLSVIDLTADDPDVQVVEIAEDLLDPPPAEEIEVSPDGAYAFLRQFGEDSIALIDLDTLTVDRLPTGQNPTDLDLSPDGARAVVVSRGSNELYVFDVENPYGDPEVIALPDDELIGSVQFSPDNTKAMLYTTAALVSHYTTWDLSTGELTVRPLIKPIQSVNVTPDGGALVVFHTEADAADADKTSEFYGEWAMSMISLSDFRRNAILLSAEPTAYADSLDGRWGFFVMEGKPFLEVLDYGNLGLKEIKLRSNPVHVGVLTGTSYAYVNQDHELGRLSFYDPDAAVLETITGFELNSGIEH